MRWFRVDNFYDTWRPLYRVTRCFGLTSLTFDFRDHSTQRTLIDQLFLIGGVFMFLFVFSSTFWYYRERVSSMSDSFLLSVGLYGVLGALAISQLIALIANYCNMKRIFKIATIIAGVDQQIATNLDYRWNYQREHLLRVVSIAGAYLQWTLFTAGLLWRVRPGKTPVQVDTIGALQSVTAFVWTMSSNQTNGVYIIQTMLTIWRRFVILNRQISNLYQVPSTLTDRTTFNDRKLIRRIAIVHDQLTDSIQLYNFCFSMHALLGVTTMFGFTLFALFGWIHTYAASHDEEMRNFAVSNVLYGGLFVLQLVELLVAAGVLNDQCRKTAVLVHKMVCYGRHDRRSIRELRIVSQQLFRKAPVITCGLFNFDWELFYTIAGSFTTYLFILIQFDLGNIDY